MVRAACVRAASGVRIARAWSAKVVGMELRACARLRKLLECYGSFGLDFTNGNDTFLEM